jgi:hypothetical protein
MEAGEIKVAGNFRDIYGHCGTWMRTIRLKDGALCMDHEGCVLSRRVRGSGIGRAWVKTCLQRYRALGVITVETDVSGEIGGYVWADMGFTFKDEAAPGMIRARRQAVLHDILHGGHISADEHQRLCAENIDLADTQEILLLGRDTSWLDEQGERQWAGKRLLSGTRWHGQLALS